MKCRVKIFACTFLSLLLVLFTLSACNMQDFMKSNEELEGKAAAMMDALIADDFDAAHGLVKGIVPESAQFVTTYGQLRSYLKGVETYEFTQIGWNDRIQNGVTENRCVYTVTTNVGDFELTVAQQSNYEGLTAFSIISEADATPVYTGTVTTLSGMSALQWVFLGLSVLTVAFTVWMLVDACGRKIKRKALWIVIILLGTASFVLQIVGGQLKLNLQLLIGAFTNYSALVLYTNPADAVILRVMFPVGAFIYCMLRKRLSAQYEAFLTPSPAVSEDPASAEADPVPTEGPLAEDAPVVSAEEHLDTDSLEKDVDAPADSNQN